MTPRMNAGGLLAISGVAITQVTPGARHLELEPPRAARHRGSINFSHANRRILSCAHPVFSQQGELQFLQRII